MRHKPNHATRIVKRTRRNNLYGLNDGTDVLAGIPATIYPSGNDHLGASDKIHHSYR